MRFLIVLFFLLSLFSCTERIAIDGSDINFSVLYDKTPVVLTSYTRDSIIKFKVGSTQQALERIDELDFPIVENASIENLQTGIIEELNPISKRNGEYTSDIILYEGEAYRVIFDFPEITEKQVWAVDTIPYLSKIKTCAVKYRTKQIENNLFALVKLNVVPSAEQKVSFYEISVFVHVSDSMRVIGDFYQSENKSYYVQLSSEDPLITKEEYYPSLLQFDACAPKKMYLKKQHGAEVFQLEFYYQHPSTGQTNILTGESEYQYHAHTATIYLKSVSENYYKYHTSRLTQINNRVGDPLYGIGEPVRVFSNIENGIGVFGTYKCDSIKTNYQRK